MVLRGMAAAAMLALVGLAGCGSSKTASTPSSPRTSSSPTTATGHVASTPVKVIISGYAYQPTSISVVPGTSITFTNRDATAHTATTTASGFDTGSLSPGQSHTVTLKTPGTYAFYCQFHAFMRGSVIVVR